ncbi:nucleotide-binding universal stress UspA family protein [Arcticibacter tournemirensis]|uniref:Universal stress protein n=1 Tax=Arcticibacter tournemirensis TaxID=699437 RepID=A0A4Q0MAY1_9SPHI|nr:universal stress protein [Arcticibacter tournemirensis]KAA8484997.1 universal stress protein [Arcticibacter tournemirensis]RXF70427.1 universal stress protein [Arcticibacter tournemirensis]TQM50552.1 nucleotide-binding universal stress UspA family protein [Arcticibacter tournemirensis]
MKSLNKLHKILIAVEDSRYSNQVASYGYDLARKLDAVVALLHVNDIPVSTPYITDPMLNEAPVVMPDVIQAQDESGKKLLDRIADTFGNGITTYTFHKLGNPKEEILLTADEWEADLVIVGTHGRTGFDHFISGSVAEKVARKAKCPVLIIPNNKDEEE